MLAKVVVSPSKAERMRCSIRSIGAGYRFATTSTSQPVATCRNREPKLMKELESGRLARI